MNQTGQFRRRQSYPAIALLALLLAGFTLRIWNLDFDQGLGTHPDERSTVCSIAPLIGWPASWDEFRDPQRSPLNPLWNRIEQRPTNFTYGHFPLYLGILTGEVLHAAAPLAEQVGVPSSAAERMARADQPCGGVAVAGRLLIALLDTLTIWLLFLLGRRSFGVGAGLLAAAFYTFTAQAIQLAHFFAMDPASTTFTVMAVLGGVMMVQERRLRAALLTGIAAGLAVASKFSALPILAVPITAAVLWLVTAQREQTGLGARSQARALGALVLALVVMGITFFVASPYAVLDWERFVKATLVDQGQMVRGVADFPFTRQYRNTLPYIYFIQQQMQWGLGWPLGILSLLGTLAAAVALVWTLARLVGAWVRGRLASLQLSQSEAANVVIWSWVAPYFGITGAFLAKFNRYMSPVLPFVVLFGAALLWLIWRWGMARRAASQEGRSWTATFAPIASGLVGAVVLVCALFWSLAYVNGVHGQEHTWITASRWIYQNAPRGSLILWESWDDPLPKTIPGEPGMDMGTTDLHNIDWSPYEEDTAEKYAILKQKLSEADFVAYSSKRIYDSVDELPQRYPMTNLYYDAMWDGRLGFEMAAEFTSPPRLFGWKFDDRYADESWSLYDHPQVTVFRKVRQLSDAEFDAIFDHSWETAIPYYRGQDSPLSPLLELMGLGNRPGSERRGLLSGLVGLLSGQRDSATVAPSARNDLLFDEPLSALPLVDNYRWNGWASEQPLAAVLTWWVVVALLGLAAWPVCFALFAPWLDRGYLFSRTMGWLLAGWLLWLLASAGWLYNTVRNSWLVVLVLVACGAGLAWRQRHALREFLATRWRLLLLEEGLLLAAFAFFVFIRMVNPDLWQPWFGGEKFMEFAFLNGVLRSPTFPPVDPHFAGGYINYYYFGLYLVAFLIKLTGVYAEVAFNLTIPLLFALTVGNAFAITHTAWSLWRRTQRWQEGVMAALLGPFLVALLGNLDGYGQIARQLSERSPVQLQSALPGVTWLVESIAGLVQVAMGRTTLPGYDFWGPSRVIPATINEFPYWSFLFADLHPHLIGIPLALFFLGALFSILVQYRAVWSEARVLGVVLLVALAFLLGALISVNLWEVPTYLGLAILTLLISEYRTFGRIRFVRVGLATVALLVGAILFYLPFFANFVNVGASGVGFVRAGDDLGLWLLVWGGLGFIVASWLLWSVSRAGLPSRILSSQSAVGDDLPSGPVQADAPANLVVDEFARRDEDLLVGGSPPAEANEPVALRAETAEVEAQSSGAVPSQGGVARLMGMSLRHFERLPRLWYLHRLLVQAPTLGYLLSVAAIPTLLVIAIIVGVLGRGVLALCLALLAVALPLLWRRERETDAADALATMLSLTGLAILAGTQVVYLKDFLQGDAWYRMNTLFKFFNQVWVLWGIASAIVLPRLWSELWSYRLRHRADPAEHVGEDVSMEGTRAGDEPVWVSPSFYRGFYQPRRGWRLLWRVACVALLAASSVYLVLGTPARLSQRFMGWVPPFGTLDGLAFMEQGRFSWPDDSHWIDLSYDSEAIHWLLDHVRGNLVIVESAEVDYYRAGGTRVASMTGLSGLRGAHVSEQRYGEQVGARDGLHREFWDTPSVERTQELIDQLQITLIYAGQLERYRHPEGVQKLANMATAGRLDVLFENEGVVIYAVPGRLAMQDGGWFVPVPQPPALSMRDGG
ncbi:MAG: glycosyltransferase family 39 protein [Caldilineaceae bacterium]|nr:glycosyltransferase family 39 protein [Caldilineaceae bacterium]